MYSRGVLRHREHFEKLLEPRKWTVEKSHFIFAREIHAGEEVQLGHVVLAQNVERVKQE